MSKAQELADKLGKEIERTVAHDVLMHDALTELRRLDRVNAKQREALEWVRGHISRYDPPGLPNHVAQRIDAALSSSGGTES